MKAVIMAGGEGRRLKSITGERPKPMVPLLGRPMMEHILLLLKKHGFDEVCAAVKYRAEDIMRYFGDGSALGVRLEYRVEREALGTAGGVKNCADFCGSDDFLVISGDAACDFDLARLMRVHRESGAGVTIALCRNAEPLRYGLAVTEPTGRIRSFIEKPLWPRVVTDFVNTGIYAVSPRVMELVPDGRAFDFGKELFPLLLRRGELIRGEVMDGYWCDIGTPRAYYRCSLDVLDGRLSPAQPDAPDDLPPQLPHADPNRRTVPCRDRAHLMRTVSEAMMEAGADFTDGLHLCDGGWELSIRPDANASALQVEANAPDAAAETAHLLELMERDENQ